MRRAILIFLVLISVAVIFLLWNVFGPAVKNPSGKYLYVPTNGTFAGLKDSLVQNGFLSGFYFFDKLSDYASLQKNIKPGKYKVDNGMSLYHLVRKLRSGRQEQVNLVITKIRTPEDLAARLGRILEIDSSTAMNFLKSNDSLNKFGVDTSTVLTDVLPNTYTFFWTSKMSTVFDKLNKAKKKFWNSERIEAASRHGLTPDGVYILASIVEEETNMQSDKGKIASVYINRLNKGMPLAADPTVKYALKDFSLKRIYQKHLEVASPYNTYKNAGLPPGPICTPSEKTIDAVLNAPETNYLFFVAKPDFSGYSNFATTYTEHLKYAKDYQQALDELMKKKQTPQ